MHLTTQAPAWSYTHASGVRWSLAGLLAFAALNALAGGAYGMNGAQAVPPEWLAGTPFQDYFVPSALLFVVVGGSLAAGAYSVATGAPHGRSAATGAALVLLVWIAAQVALIGYVSWLQPAVAVAALAILGLAYLLPMPVQNE